MIEELTYGEKAVGLTFNPSGNEQVQQIKVAYAKLIDQLYWSLIVVSTEVWGAEEKNELIREAIRQAQTAQMWAVKSVTWDLIK